MENKNASGSPQDCHTTLIEQLETLYRSYSNWLKNMEECERERQIWGGIIQSRERLEEMLDQWRKDGRPEISWQECRQKLERSAAYYKQLRENNPCGVLSPNDQKLSHAAGDSRQPETRSEN